MTITTILTTMFLFWPLHYLQRSISTDFATIICCRGLSSAFLPYHCQKITSVRQSRPQPYVYDAFYVSVMKLMRHMAACIGSRWSWSWWDASSAQLRCSHTGLGIDTWAWPDRGKNRSRCGSSQLAERGRTDLYTARGAAENGRRGSRNLSSHALWRSDIKHEASALSCRNALLPWCSAANLLCFSLYS